MNLDWHVRPLDDLVLQIRVRATARPMMIAANGYSSSGKTTLARRVAAALDSCHVLHTDDIAWHQGVFAWDALLINDVLPVVRSGRPLRYRPQAWEQRRREGAVELAVSWILDHRRRRRQPAVGPP